MPLAQWIVLNLQPGPTTIGVVVDGTALVSKVTQPTISLGGLEINGSVQLSFDSVLRQLLPYTIGNTVYLENGQQYIVVGFYWNLDQELIYEIKDYTGKYWVPVSMLYRDRSIYYQNQLAIIDQQIADLSE